MTSHLIKHNPAFLDGRLREEFVVRRAHLEGIMEIVSENRRGANQHVLVITGRGMGKTTLVRRVVLAIQDDPVLSQRWQPVLLPEECYAVASAGELWVEVLGALARLETGNAPRWSEAYRRLRTERDELRLREQSLARLSEWSDEEGRGLLVVVENLNLIFGDQADVDAGWSLRATLLNEPRIMLLATATTVFDEIERPDRALYEMFREIRLDRLSSGECAILWRHVTGEDLAVPKQRAVEILTGGNPRLLAMLANFSAGRSFRELLLNLSAVVDDYTPYFKACIEALPPLERRVFVVLADAWKPSLAREVAKLARLAVNDTSEYLRRLTQRGAVERTGKRGRGHLYQVAERLFNLYHLLRRGGSEAERARATVDFMARFYGREESAGSIAKEYSTLPEGERELHVEAFRHLVAERSGEYVSTPEEIRELSERLPEVRQLLEVAPATAGRPDEAVAACDDVIRRFADREETAMREWLSIARVAAASGLFGMEREVEARARLAAALSAPPLPERAARYVIDCAISLSAQGHATAILDVLAASPSAVEFEPLLVALRMVLGEEVRAPQEVVEVARDIMRRIQEHGGPGPAGGS